ncbi:hypothetical protein N7541_010647 [Penicillium brevicompactum]|uniref:Uncharacterized protein n=1 Tax=Penicillium brevicompactum TaxID=5074 RepID=A0A9W9UHM7_PENBR|nr:hypothetical protein N7541_010647 [Penicillium brevicompactum]
MASISKLDKHRVSKSRTSSKASLTKVARKPANPKLPVALGGAPKRATRWDRELKGLELNEPTPRRDPTAPRDLQWAYTEEAQIPGALLKTKVSGCELDFLDLGPGSPNHVIMRLIFQRTKHRRSAHNPPGTTGLRLSIEVSLGEFSDEEEEEEEEEEQEGLETMEFESGDFVVKSIRYNGPHRDSAHTIPLTFTGNGVKTVEDILNIVAADHMTPCGFNFSDTDVVGCRDFMSQLVWKCIAAGIVVDDPDIKIPFERYFTLPSNGGPAIPPNRPDLCQTSSVP